RWSVPKLPAPELTAGALAAGALVASLDDDDEQAATNRPVPAHETMMIMRLRSGILLRAAVSLRVARWYCDPGAVRGAALAPEWERIMMLGRSLGRIGFASALIGGPQLPKRCLLVGKRLAVPPQW